MAVKELFDLAGKVVLITGGSRGLGLQMAQALGEMGCRLAITARRQDELDAAKEQLAALGMEVMTVAGDLAKFDSIPGMVDTVLAQYGTIDILVNNAGTSWGAPVEDYPLEAWNKVMDLNMTATFLMSQLVGKKVLIPKRAGKIINISSNGGLSARREISAVAYSTSKAAVLNFTRVLACEWGKHQINVNAICPGFFYTKIAQRTLDVIGESVIAQTPLGRLGDEQDLMGSVVFLASQASRHITGQYLTVDGGISIA